MPEGDVVNPLNGDVVLSVVVATPAKAVVTVVVIEVEIATHAAAAAAVLARVCAGLAKSTFWSPVAITPE